MDKTNNKDIFWQQIRGGTILAVIFIHCHNGVELPLNSINGASYFILRNLMNFPVNMFFFMSGFFMKPVDDVKAFYKKRLPKLVIPYLFYTVAYLGMSAVFGNGISVKRIILAVFLGTASTPLYYIVVLTYFTLLAPFLLKTVQSKKNSIIIMASAPAFLLVAYAIRFAGTDIWNYLKYTPVWLSFYYLGMIIKAYKPAFNRTILWILLPVSFACELISTRILLKPFGVIAYSQMRFAGAFFSVIIILLAYEYSKKSDKNDKCKWLAVIGDDSYAIYYMHCAFLMVFTRVITFKDNSILPLYQFGEIIFAVLMCESAIFVIKKVFKSKKMRLIFGV